MTYAAPPPRLPADSANIVLSLPLADPSSDLLVRHVRLLRDCVALAQQRWGFGIDAAVVLPGELQLLCVYPDGDFGVRGTVRLIQSAFARHVPGQDGPIWADAVELMEITSAVVPLRRSFMENAPVRAGLVRHAADWPYSSAQRDTVQVHQLGVNVA